jgi:hypothetical protein
MLSTLYAVIVALLLLVEDRLLYLPDPASDWVSPGSLTVEDVELTSADGTKIHAWWVPYPGSAGALLYCHGNAGNLSHRAGMLARLKERLKMPILIFDYPGYGRSAGRPSEAGCYAAADAAHDWLIKERKIDPKRIVLFGKSLGGAVAADLASRRPHQALVLVMSFTSAPDVGRRTFPFVPTRLLMRNRLDTLAKVRRCVGPVFLAHGLADWQIPASHSERLYEAVTGPRRYFPMPGVGHGDPVLTDEALDALDSFLREVETASPN